MNKYSVRRVVFTACLSVLALTALTCDAQTQSANTSPTAGETPLQIDQTWQHASSKYDAARKALLTDVDRAAMAGPFSADWESLRRYEIPEWYKDAKFGIFIHWGVYSVPAFGSEWYPRLMYQEGSEENKHQIATYGPLTQFGYKDFIPRFTATHFDPNQWAELFKASGAKYVVPVFEHHDGFAMYDSGLSDWTAVKMGPHRDVYGELAKALRERGLRLGASSHRIEHDFFLDGGRKIASDVNDPAYAAFYGPAHSWLDGKKLYWRIGLISATSISTIGWRAMPKSWRNIIRTSCISIGGLGSPMRAATSRSSQRFITTAARARAKFR